MQQPKAESSIRLYAMRFSYFFMAVLSFYLLFLSRSDEVYTVWGAIHPAFLPLFFAASFMLILITFSREKTGYKLLFVGLHSVLSHSFFVIIFPAGDVGGQQTFLGVTRLIYDNVIFHGYGWRAGASIASQIYQCFRGLNFLAALTVILARMLAIDVYWLHLFLVPIFWGVFVPVSAFMLTKTLTRNENISILSSSLTLLFPPLIYWGAISTPYSLGLVFFAYYVFFLLKYLSNDTTKTKFMMVIFAFLSFLAHFLTGMISIALFLLAMTMKRYKEERKEFPLSANAFLVIAFVLSTSLLPLSLVYLKVFYPIYSYVSLEKLLQLPAAESLELLILGGYTNLRLPGLLVYGASPFLGLAGFAYLWIVSRKRKFKKLTAPVLFLFLGFLMHIINHRILNLFIINVPFGPARLWLSQQLIAVPFIAIVINSVAKLLPRSVDSVITRLKFCFFKESARPSFKSVEKYAISFASLLSIAIASIMTPVAVSSWATVGVYYAYPHYAPLQTTSYELEAAIYIDRTTPGRYLVIADQWMIFAGAMFVGKCNPRAFYFSYFDPKGVSLFNEMKNNPLPETLIEAMETNNATTAYFIIEKPRLGTEQYNRVIQQAQQNNLQTYQTFQYQGEEKLHIFYYQEQSPQN